MNRFRDWIKNHGLFIIIMAATLLGSACGFLTYQDDIKHGRVNSNQMVSRDSSKSKDLDLGDLYLIGQSINWGRPPY